MKKTVWTEVARHTQFWCTQIGIPMLFGLIVGQMPANAEDYNQLRQRVWDNDPQVQMTQTKLEFEQQIRNGQSNPVWVPNLALSTRNDRLAANNGMQENELELEWTGLAALNAQQPIADRNITLAQAERDNARLHASLRFYRALSQLQNALHIKLIGEQLQNQLNLLLNDATRNISAGEMAASAITPLKIEQLKVRREILRYQHNYVTAQQTLYGLFQSTPLPTVDGKLQNGPELPAWEAVVLPQPHTDISAVSGVSPVLLLAQSRWLLANAKSNYAHNYWRDISVSLLLRHEQLDRQAETDQSTGFRLRIPLGISTERRQEQNNSAREEMELKAQWQSLQRDMQQQQTTAQLNLKEAESQLALNTEQLTLAQTQRQQIELQRKQGELALADLLRAYAEESSSQIAHAQAVDSVVKARADWYEAFGVIP